MIALIADPAESSAVGIGKVPEPVPGPGQVLVEVHHVSLNHGDLNDARSGRVPAGAALGSDAAGVVIQAAADGSGPAAGTRVVALTPGAFAQRVAVDADSLAVVPDHVGLPEAATLPVAGLAAFRSLRSAGLAAGQRVLVTGASGGVGRFAVQIAARAGVHVIASVGSAVRGLGLAEAGAAEVLVGLDGIDRPVDVVIDSVGGPQMVAAWELLRPGGSLQVVGWTSGEPAAFPPYSLVGPQKSISSFLIEGPVGDDLAALVGLLGAGAVVPQIGWRSPWQQVAEVAEALHGRRVDGKAVLDLLS
jgi:NADPH:quinone reductase-like Zn-dependent oxidoreductase